MIVIINGQKQDIGDKTSLSYREVVQMVGEARGRKFQPEYVTEREAAFGIRIPVANGEEIPPLSVTWRKASGSGTLSLGQYVTAEEGMVINAVLTNKA